MKKIIAFALLLITCSVHAQQRQLVKLWETDTVVAVPESVLPDPSGNTLYVSLIDGSPWEADGKGGIGKLSADGKKYNGRWVTGLNAPKGMGKFGNKLYAADISEVVVIDLTTGKLIKKIKLEGASGLNDITVSDKGIVYVSDSKTSRIWSLKSDKPSVYLENVKDANGLKAVKNDLIYAEGPVLMKSDVNKKLTKIAEVPESIDGIEPVGNGDFIVTSWSGYVYYVHAGGAIQTLLDTHVEKMNTADLGYDPVKRILYIPTFFAKKVVAYSLK